MKIHLLMIGKSKEKFTEEGYNFYKKRITNYLPFDDFTIPGLRNAGNLLAADFKLREGELLTKHFKEDDYVVLLDEQGRKFSSVDFAGFIQQRMNSGIKNLTFVIGGAYGFSKDVYNRSNEKISLSAMTFPHQLVRIIFMEQLYRAMTILRNEPYHNE